MIISVDRWESFGFREKSSGARIILAPEVVNHLVRPILLGFQSQGYIKRPASTFHEEQQGLACFGFSDQSLILFRIFHSLAVYLFDEIPASQAGLSTSATRLNVGNQHTLLVPGPVKLLCQFRCQGLHGKAETSGNSFCGL